MTQFKYARVSFYPDLDLEVRLRVNRYEGINYTAKASVVAKGQPGARQRWRDEFWKWAENRNLDAVSPRYGNRRIDGTSIYDCWLKDWQTVADFVIMWVGLEALTNALTEREAIDDRVGKQLQKLTIAVGSLTEIVARIEQSSKKQDRAWELLRSGLLQQEEAKAL